MYYIHICFKAYIYKLYNYSFKYILQKYIIISYRIRCSFRYRGNCYLQKICILGNIFYMVVAFPRFLLYFNF